MNIKIDPKIAEIHGSVKIAYLVISGIVVSKTPPREKKIARIIEAELRSQFNEIDFTSDFYIKEWLAFASQMRIEKPELLPAQIGLIKNILLGRDIPKINNVVDAGNIIAAKFRCPVGIFDLSTLGKDVTLRKAGAGERYTPMFELESTELLQGEVVYADEMGIFSRYSKDSDRTKITELTDTILCVIDGTNGIFSEHLLNARTELAQLLKEVAGDDLKIESDLVIAK